MNTETSAVLHLETATSSKTSVKIAYIGGGSREWAVKLMADLALSDVLTGQVDLYDIDLEASQHNEALGAGVFSHPDSVGHFKVRAVSNLSTALLGADFVIISIEPGPTALRKADLQIPARYGILQTVGDTTGPGGLMRALRCVPIYRKLVASIMEICPDAWVINYTNPMSVCTGALLRAAPGIKAFGCCHEVFATQKLLAKKVAEWFGVAEPDREEIELDIAGVNHFTFASRAYWNGNDLMPKLHDMLASPSFFDDRTEQALAAKSEERWFDSEHLVAFDFLRRYGALGAAGDRHLAEFVSGYLKDADSMHRWGVVATPFDYRMARSRAPRPTLEMIAKEGIRPSGEEGVRQIEALLGLRQLTTNINVPNVGQIDALPRGAIVETYARMGHDSICPLMANPLPVGLMNLQSHITRQQMLTLDAAWESDLDLAYQVLLGDPLVSLSPDEIWKMLSEMVEECGEFIPAASLS